MSHLDQVLQDDVSRLLERLAGSIPGGCLEATVTRNPGLRRRLDEVETQLATLRASLQDGYGRWRRALDDRGRGRSASRGRPSLALVTA